MKLRLIFLILMVFVASTPSRAQEDEAFERVDLRVISAAPGGVVVVDRGKDDGLAVGDRVRLHPRGGATRKGVVIQLDERSAVVELRDKTYAPAPGTRGEALVHRSRLAPVPEEEPPEEVAEPQEKEGEGEAEPGEEPLEGEAQHLPWENQDEEWSADMPLLAAVKPVRPDQRAKRATGRMYLIGDMVYTSENDGFSNSVFRLGMDVVFENPFDYGGGLHMAGQVYYLTDYNDDQSWDGLVDRMSYFSGGTRFSATRWEAGRFLQHGYPEFGILDGFEWGRRRDGGDRYGVSLGFLPELDDDLRTGDDFQMAAYYDVVMGDREQLTLGGAYQKTLHHGDSDRDLFITKINYLALDGWDLWATAWIDYYSSSENFKDAGVELTYAVASLRRDWERNGLDLTYRHQRFPETDRTEFKPGLIANLANDHYDRLALRGWSEVADKKQLYGEVGGWIDQEEEGGDLVLGLEIEDLWADRSRADFSVFATEGRFSTVLGGRFSYGRYMDNGRWDVFYEISNNRQDAFSTNFEDILQHRLHGSVSLHTFAGWSISVFAEANIYDQEGAWSTGLYLQKTF